MNETKGEQVCMQRDHRIKDCKHRGNASTRPLPPKPSKQSMRHAALSIAPLQDARSIGHEYKKRWS
jgi:hypothetical protein